MYYRKCSIPIGWLTECLSTDILYIQNHLSEKALTLPFHLFQFRYSFRNGIPIRKEYRKTITSIDILPKNIQSNKDNQERKQMKVTRLYANPEKAIDVRSLLTQLVHLELDKLVNTDKVNSPTSHGKMTIGGDYS